METLAFLVGQERHAECEEPQESVLDCVHVRTHPGLRTEAGFAERDRDPFRAGDLAPSRIPLAPARDDGDEALQEVAARGDQLGLELPTALRIEGQREIRGHFEIALDRLGCLDPYERFARGHDGSEVGERFDDERLQGRNVAHAEAASSAPPRTASLTSFTSSYWARARTRESPRRRNAERRSSAWRSTQMSIIRSSNDRRSSRFPRIRSSSPTTSSNMWILRSRSSIRFASTVSSAHTFTTWTSRSWPSRRTRPAFTFDAIAAASSRRASRRSRSSDRKSGLWARRRSVSATANVLLPISRCRTIKVSRAVQGNRPEADQ